MIDQSKRNASATGEGLAVKIFNGLKGERSGIGAQEEKSFVFPETNQGRYITQPTPILILEQLDPLSVRTGIRTRLNFLLEIHQPRFQLAKPIF